MSTSRFSPSHTSAGTTQDTRAIETEPGHHKDGYQWTALSVTTVGALLASMLSVLCNKRGSDDYGCVASGALIFLYSCSYFGVQTNLARKLRSVFSL